MAEEREFKADVAESFVLPDLDGCGGLGAHDRGTRLLEATYWDTDGLDLMHRGLGLRYRTTDGAKLRWTLKAGTHREGDAVVREEIEIAGDPDRLPPEIAARTSTVVPESALRPVARLRTLRHVVDLSDGSVPIAEVADDRVTVLRGEDEVHRFREVEVELHGGDEGRVRDVLDRLRAAGAGPPSASSKYVRALRALGYEVPADPPD